jgi:hypothetical protein
MRLGPCEFQILLCKAIMLWADQYCNWREIEEERVLCKGVGSIYFSRDF